ncbi:hypothetical protein GCM10027168_32120 [Streptomyces capparidis]
MTERVHAADVMNRSAAGHRTLQAEIEQVRREARRRFGGLVLDLANPGSYFRNRHCRPPQDGIFERAGDLGLMRFSLPPEIGGDGRDKLAWGVVVEELARLSRDPGFAVLLDITVEITELIYSSGRPELIERYVPDLVAGRRFGVQGAFESRDPWDYESTARLDGDEWVLNGAKRFLAGARFADVYVLFLRDAASNDILAFVVDRDDPGVTPVPLETMGLHSMGLGQVVLHEVRLPQWRLLWRADALSELNTYARIRRTMSACGIVGAVDGLVEACVESLAERRRGGRRVLDYPNVERSVGEMRALLEAARAAVYRALDHTRSPDRDPYFDEFATIAKHHASACALRIGELVMHLQGGEGYMSAFPWERWMRDLMGMIGGQGSQEILLLQLGQRAIVDLEGARVRQDAAERAVTALADSWWALHAASVHGSAPHAWAPAVAETVEAAGLGAVADGPRRELDALLERAHGLLADAAAGRLPDKLPQCPAGLFDGRAARVAEEAWRLLACAVAHRTGLLARLLEPCTVREAAGELPEALTGQVLDALVDASLVRRDDQGRHTVAEGLERVLIGGPRAAAFAARLRRAVDGAARLRAAGPASGRRLAAGCGADAAALADVLVNALLGRLEGLPVLLDRPGLAVGCAAGDGGRSAAELARHIPFTPVLALEPRELPDAGVRVRVGGAAAFTEDDRLALAWLPAAGLTGDELGEAVASAAGALVPGGWLVVPCPLLPKRPLGAAAARLDLALTGAPAPEPGVVEELLRSAGLGHVRTAWADPALGLRLLAARRP